MSTRPSETGEFTSWDQTQLVYRTWAPSQPGKEIFLPCMPRRISSKGLTICSRNYSQEDRKKTNV